MYQVYLATKIRFYPDPRLTSILHTAIPHCSSTIYRKFNEEKVFYVDARESIAKLGFSRVFLHAKVDAGAVNDAFDDRVHEAVIVAPEVVHHELRAVGVVAGAGAGVALSFMLHRHLPNAALEDVDHFVCDFSNPDEIKVHAQLMQLVDHVRWVHALRATLRVLIRDVVIHFPVAGRVGEKDAQTHRAAPRQCGGVLQSAGDVSDISTSCIVRHECMHDDPREGTGDQAMFSRRFLRSRGKAFHRQGAVSARRIRNPYVLYALACVRKFSTIRQSRNL